MDASRFITGYGTTGGERLWYPWWEKKESKFSTHKNKKTMVQWSRHKFSKLKVIRSIPLKMFLFFSFLSIFFSSPTFLPPFLLLPPPPPPSPPSFSFFFPKYFLKVAPLVGKKSPNFHTKGKKAHKNHGLMVKTLIY